MEAKKELLKFTNGLKNYTGPEIGCFGLQPNRTQQAIDQNNQEKRMHKNLGKLTQKEIKLLNRLIEVGMKVNKSFDSEDEE